MDTLTKIRKLLETVSRDNDEQRFALCLEIVRAVDEDETARSASVQLLLDEGDFIKTSASKCPEIEVSSAELSDLKHDLGKIVDTMFELYLKKNLDPKVFYEKISDNIWESPLFDSEKTRAFALYYLWIDARIPYYQLDSGMLMGDEEFRRLTEILQRKISKARFILITNYLTQRTQRASELLKILDEVGAEDEERRVVLLAHIISLASMHNSSVNIARRD